MKYFILLAIALPLQAFAWGGRGHHSLCDAAVFLVKNPELSDFLHSRPQVMGHLCNIPDTFWRNGTKEQTAEGNPSHFLDSEVIPMAITSFPADYKMLVTEWTGKNRTNGKEIKSIPHELGSLWWRADQFYRRSLSGKEALANAKEGFKLEKADEQNEANPYNQAVYAFYTNLGIMGHFVGDASMPFHVTEDYDGYDKGHGGIHTYYEDGIIAAFDGDLTWRIVQEARKMQKASRPESFLTAKGVIEKMRALSIASYAEINKVLIADKFKKPSEVHEDGGKKIRTAAERESTQKNFKKFEALAVKHLARGAVLLAQLWDEAYADAGNPNLKAYKSYKYPFQPEFVMPDYYDVPASEPAAKRAD